MKLTPTLFILIVVLGSWTAVLGAQSFKLYNLATALALETQCTTSPKPSRPSGFLSV